MNYDFVETHCNNGIMFDVVPVFVDGRYWDFETVPHPGQEEKIALKRAKNDIIFAWGKSTLIKKIPF